MASAYLLSEKRQQFPRLPLQGALDLTYRCNNHCRHCWLWVSSQEVSSDDELSFEEIKKIAEDARGMGCREWAISGGEPMLRPDFADIFELLTSRAVTYSLNTNGTFITPKIAQLLKRKGQKMIALYGATAEVHDHITRHPGSFEMTMRGFRYLQEAGALFMVQLIPMKDNYHQFEQMKELALSLSKDYRIGSAWLHLSASRDPKVNEEILAQRLPPGEVVVLDKPDMVDLEIKHLAGQSPGCYHHTAGYLLGTCVEQREYFHVDPYGGMTFCSLIKDPSLRYDLREGNFKQAWEEFIPSLVTKIPISGAYHEQCGSCDLREDCRICPVFAYLEQGDFGEKVDYLCAVAKENKSFKDAWLRDHRRYFQVAGITCQVDFATPAGKDFFAAALKKFEVLTPGKDVVSVRHYLGLPDLQGQDWGQEVYRHPPWAVYRKGDSWIYLAILPDESELLPYKVAVFNQDHSRGVIYHAPIYWEHLQKDGQTSFLCLPTDQILLARILPDRQALYLHSCGVSWDGRGYLFAGHSGSGKSTIAQMLPAHVELLCDDRIIVRKHEDGFRIHGTWHHGTVPEVSNGSAPLKAIFFINQSLNNEACRMQDKKEIVHRLLSVVIKPLVSADWWGKTLTLVETIAEQVPCYELYCDKSGRIVSELENVLDLS